MCNRTCVIDGNTVTYHEYLLGLYSSYSVKLEEAIEGWADILEAYQYGHCTGKEIDGVIEDMMSILSGREAQSTWGRRWEQTLEMEDKAQKLIEELQAREHGEKKND